MSRHARRGRVSAARAGRPNQRRFRRCTVRVLIDYQSPHGVRCDYATTLGAGGLFIQTEEPLPVGSPIKVRFRLPGAEFLHEIEGRVAWTHQPEPDRALVNAPGMGVEFIDSNSTGRLARELERLA